MNINRRRFLLAAGAFAGSTVFGLGRTRAASGSGNSVSEAFDREMESFMTARNVPGGALAVIKDGRLVYARGYGWADRDKKEPVKPDSLFRIASISKPITAVALLQLVKSGALDLDSPITRLLCIEPIRDKDKALDDRLGQVTVRHCLHHTGGWDRDASGDPMFRSREIARAAGVPAPARQLEIIRYMFGRSLDFDPGTRFAYSNFGYCLLGRVIEKISGQGYEQFVKKRVLDPIGIGRMRLGASLESGRAPGEVKYYTVSNRKADSVFADVRNKVPAPYGSFCLEAMDAHGGWLASAIDLARFASALEAKKDNLCLDAETRRLLYEPPPPPVSRKADGSLADHYYACGWSVRPVEGREAANYWHNGSLPGTFTLLVRRHDGLIWAALFNQRSENNNRPDGAIDAALHRAADAVTAWPDHDLSL